jgi:hypothetical protein
MKLNIEIGYGFITVKEPNIEDTYYIKGSSELGFYIQSDNGYDCQGIISHKSIDAAIKHVKKLIADYFIDRCEVEPKGWRK